MELVEQAQHVHSRETFIRFMNALLEDWHKKHKLIRRDDGADTRIMGTPWKNCCCPDFIEAMRTWIADSAQVPPGFSYRTLAEIMAASASYDRRGMQAECQQADRLNCWEFKKCGREPGGAKAAELGVCPAAVWDNRKDANGGLHGGRICWVLVGTLCGGKVQGTFADKMGNCARCEFYQYVREGEGEGFRYVLPRQ